MTVFMGSDFLWITAQIVEIKFRKFYISKWETFLVVNNMQHNTDEKVMLENEKVLGSFRYKD